MRIKRKRLFKYTWTGTAGDDTADMIVPDTIEMVDPGDGSTVIKTLGADEAVNIVGASRITVQYDTDEITGAATFDFHALTDVFDSGISTKHTAYSTLDSAKPKDNIRAVPVTPGPTWIKLRIDANADFGDGESVYCYMLVIE